MKEQDSLTNKYLYSILPLKSKTLIPKCVINIYIKEQIKNIGLRNIRGKKRSVNTATKKSCNTSRKLKLFIQYCINKGNIYKIELYSRYINHIEGNNINDNFKVHWLKNGKQETEKWYITEDNIEMKSIKNTPTLLNE